jgi:hypothetical protein
VAAPTGALYPCAHCSTDIGQTAPGGRVVPNAGGTCTTCRGYLCGRCAGGWCNGAAVDTYSFKAIDVGFDLRVHPDMAIELPAGERLRVQYGDDGETFEGTRAEVALALRKAGYRVEAIEGEARP